MGVSRNPNSRATWRSSWTEHLNRTEYSFATFLAYHWVNIRSAILPFSAFPGIQGSCWRAARSACYGSAGTKDGTDGCLLRTVCEDTPMRMGTTFLRDRPSLCPYLSLTLGAANLCLD